MAEAMRDVFVCHAGEDKSDVVAPLVEAFSEAGISCWYDEAQIQWGDSITQKVNGGLPKSRYVLVVFSPAFIEKNWPQRELNAVLNLEASTGDVKVLPLLVGTEQQRRQILARFPLLNDKRYLRWGGNPRDIVDAMLSRLGRGGASGHGRVAAVRPELDRHIPLPKIKKRFTQRDRDLFLQNAFAVVKRYFKDGLEELARQHQEVETDFSEVHSFKFLATIYVRGEVANRCKIWMGSLASTASIAYCAGQLNIDRDDSWNEMLSVADDEQALKFRPLGMWPGRPEADLLTAEQAAEYLWLLFTETLGQGGS